MQLVTNFDYPINVGGRPLYALTAFAVIAFELTILFSALAAARNFTFEQAEPIIGGADCCHLLDDQLSTFVKPLEATGNGECYEQSDQCENSALHGGEPRDAAGTFLPQISQAQASPVIKQSE